jgi:hypothetical protein
MDFPFELIKEVNFKSRKVPLSPDLRPMKKISQILLVLFLASRNSSASIMKLQLFNWAFKTNDPLKTLLNFVENRSSSVIRIDPTLIRAINIAMAEGYIEFNESSKKFSLLDKGISLATSIMGVDDILNTEKVVLNTIGKNVSEKIISSFIKEV